jgi:hypothetical protein
MPYDLAAACKSARAHIDVPAVPLDAIRAHGVVASTPPRRWHAAVLAIGIPLFAAAASAALWQDAHILRLPHGGLFIASQGSVVTISPTGDQVQRAIDAAGFAVTRPAGLPDGTKLIKIMTAPALIVFTYDLPGAWRGRNHFLNVLVVNAKAKAIEGNRRAYHTGDEAVFIQRESLTPGELARVVAAMHLVR